MPLALFVAAAALANPGVLVVPSPGSPAPAAIVGEVSELVDRSGVVALELPPSADLDALRGTLARGVRECFPDLSEAQRGALVRLQQAHGDELFVALPTGEDARDTFVWRFEPQQERLDRVLTRRIPPLPAPADPADVRVIFLPWPGAGQTGAVLGDLAVLGPVHAEVTVGGPDLDRAREQLMAASNECTPALDAASAAALAEAAAADDPPLYLAVKDPKQRDPYTWRWTADGLRKVLVFPGRS